MVGGRTPPKNIVFTEKVNRLAVKEDVLSHPDPVWVCFPRHG